MSYASEEQITELIIQYAKKDKTNYAILIDGEWGCGKTYFIKNILFDKITNKKPIYISLYGVSSCDEILKLIWFQTMPFKKSSRLLTVKLVELQVPQQKL